MRKILIFLALTFVLMGTVSAGNMFKQNLCVSANISTFSDCDDYWDAFLNATGLSPNQATSGFNESNFYNKTELDEKIANASVNANESGFYNKTDVDNLVDNKTRALRDSIAENYALKSEVSSGNSNNSNSSDGISSNTLLIGGLVVVLVVGFLYMNNQKKAQPRGSSQSYQGQNLNSELLELLRQKNKAENKPDPTTETPTG